MEKKEKSSVDAAMLMTQDVRLLLARRTSKRGKKASGQQAHLASDHAQPTQTSRGRHVSPTFQLEEDTSEMRLDVHLRSRKLPSPRHFHANQQISPSQRPEPKRGERRKKSHKDMAEGKELIRSLCVP